MLTIEKLREFGANVDEGMSRCMNNETFYLRLVNMALQDGGFERLRQAVESGDKKEGFEAAHALKGMLGNLSLTPPGRTHVRGDRALSCGSGRGLPDLVEQNPGTARQAAGNAG